MGVLLKACGLRVTAIKIDPYLNSDAGTMSPFEHGEVFVLNDGGEADLDLGNYERFLDVTLTRDHNLTTGKVYSKVINAERAGSYLGKTVQVIPHVTDAIQDWIEKVAEKVVDAHTLPPIPPPPPSTGTNSVFDAAAAAAQAHGSADVCLIEVGGTVGDIESLVFLEALRQFQFRVGMDNVCLVHVSLVPVVGAVGEQKTKPTQHSVKELRSVGLNPDIIICRSAQELSQSTREKLALFCQVKPQHVLSVADVPNIFHVPLVLESQGTARFIADKLKLQIEQPDLSQWAKLARDVDLPEIEVHIALVGKYTGLQDSYLSVIKSLQHAAVAAGRRLVVDWLEASALEKGTEASDPETHASNWKTLREADGILVPGGFGDRGVEGKILAIQYARENQRPFLGICLGMQCAVIEFARNVVGLKTANSAEFDKNTTDPVVIFMPEVDATKMGGTMRLGARLTKLESRGDHRSTLAEDVYGKEERLISERHRHRYEVNPAYVDRLQSAGLIFSGKDAELGNRMEIVELERVSSSTSSSSSSSSSIGSPITTHPFFFASQYHPEFQSHPHRPSPPFFGFVLAASGQSSRIPMAHAPVVKRKPRGLSTGSYSGTSSTPPRVADSSSSNNSSTSSSSSSSSASSTSSSSTNNISLGSGKPPLPSSTSSVSSTSHTVSSISSGPASPSPGRPMRLTHADAFPAPSSLGSVPAGLKANTSSASAHTSAQNTPSSFGSNPSGAFFTSAASQAALALDPSLAVVAAGGVTVQEGTYRADPC